MDGRDKPGHDGEGVGTASQLKAMASCIANTAVVWQFQHLRAEGAIGMVGLLTADEAKKSAWAKVGAYFCHFSDLEATLNDALVKVFDLDDRQIFVAAALDIQKKVDLLGSAIKSQDGAADWKGSCDEILKRASAANNVRVLFAHSQLLPQESGSVRLLWWRTRDRKTTAIDEAWDATRFNAECDTLIKLAGDVKTVIVGKVMPLPVGWMNNSWEVAAQIASRRVFNPALYSPASMMPPLPLKSGDDR